jgi:hypothetical protein
MATVTPTQPLTTAAFLFGEGQDSVDALTHALEDQSVLGSLGGGLDKLSRPGRKAAGGQLASVAHGLLDLDLGDLVVGVGAGMSTWSQPPGAPSPPPTAPRWWSWQLTASPRPTVPLSRCWSTMFTSPPCALSCASGLR